MVMKREFGNVTTCTGAVVTDASAAAYTGECLVWGMILGGVTVDATATLDDSTDGSGDNLVALECAAESGGMVAMFPVPIHILTAAYVTLSAGGAPTCSVLYSPV